MGGAKGLAYCGGKSGVGAKRWCQVPMIWGAFREWTEIQMLKKKDISFWDLKVLMWSKACIRTTQIQKRGH